MNKNEEAWMLNKLQVVLDSLAYEFPKAKISIHLMYETDENGRFEGKILYPYAHEKDTD